jgi:hypothetical protein
MSGSLLITGHVRRGRHVRSTVPYRSTTSFGSNLGSASLNSFLRDTAGSEDFGRYSAKYRTQPYYSQSQTVTTMVPGRSGVFRPTSTTISSRVQQDTHSAGTDVFGLEPLLKEQALSGQGTAATDSVLQGPQTQYSPLVESILSRAESRPTPESTIPRDTSLSQRKAERLVRSETGTRRQSEMSAVERFREQVQEIQDKLQDSEKIPSRESSLLVEHPESSFEQREMSIENLKSRLESQVPAESTTDEKQTAAADHRLPTLNDVTTSTDSRLQKDLILQKGTDWSDISRELQTEQEKSASGTGEILETGKGDTAEQLSVGSGLTGTRQELQQRDVLEQIKRQLDDLTRSIGTRLQNAPDDEQKDKSSQLPTNLGKTRLGSLQYTPDSPDTSSLYEFQGAAPRFGEDELTSVIVEEKPVPAVKGKEQTRLTPTELEPLRSDWAGMTGYESSQKKISPLDKLNELSRAELSAEAKRIMGSHTSIESFSEAKFNQHMLTAENYLQAGRYYHAANSFALASIYKPNDPAALAGKGHALFAAGEYVSSGLFISRALANGPEYTRTKVNLVAILGGENKLAGKIADVKQWLARSGSSELQFLLSYVYYRSGKLSQAKERIDAASGKLPQSPAIRALKKAIYEGIATP